MALAELKAVCFAPVCNKVCVCARTCIVGISVDTHPRTVPILTQLGYVYSRTARVMFAEGLFRECAKILKVGLG